MRELLLDARSVLGERLEGGCRGEVMEYGRCLVQRKASREDDKWAGRGWVSTRWTACACILHVTGPLVVLQDLNDADVLCLQYGFLSGTRSHPLYAGPL